MAVFKRFRAVISRKIFLNRTQFAEPISNLAGHHGAEPMGRAVSNMRRAAWIDFLFVDFGILRFLWKNRARIGPRAFRMNQPYPSDIAWAAREGIRTIVTARHDPRHGGHALVRDACEKLGLNYRTVPFFSREAPSREALQAAAAFFAEAEYPLLIHCKSGADRAGILSALYLILAENTPVRVARQQLSLKFLHFRASRTGILDAVFDAYLAANPDESVRFMDWVETDYDAQRLTRDFKARGFADFIDRILLRRE